MWLSKKQVSFGPDPLWPWKSQKAINEAKNVLLCCLVFFFIFSQRKNYVWRWPFSFSCGLAQLYRSVYARSGRHYFDMMCTTWALGWCQLAEMTWQTSCSTQTAQGFCTTPGSRKCLRELLWETFDMGALTGKGDNWLNSHMFHDFCLVQGFLGIFVREKLK